MSNSIIPTAILQEVMDAMDDMATDSRLLDMKQSRVHQFDAARDVLRAAMERPQGEREPVAWYDGNKFYGSKAAASMNMANMSVLSPVYLHQQHQPKPLTDEAVLGVAKSIEIQFDSERLNEQIDDILAFARAIERAHGIGGEA